MNIALSLDDDLVKEVRKIAVERDTALTGMVGDYPERLAPEGWLIWPRAARTGNARAIL